MFFTVGAFCPLLFEHKVVVDGRHRPNGGGALPLKLRGQFHLTAKPTVQEQLVGVADCSRRGLGAVAPCQIRVEHNRDRRQVHERRRHVEAERVGKGQTVRGLHRALKHIAGRVSGEVGPCYKFRDNRDLALVVAVPSLLGNSVGNSPDLVAVGIAHALTTEAVAFDAQCFERVFHVATRVFTTLQGLGERRFRQRIDEELRDFLLDARCRGGVHPRLAKVGLDDRQGIAHKQRVRRAPLLHHVEGGVERRDRLTVRTLSHFRHAF